MFLGGGQCFWEENHVSERGTIGFRERDHVSGRGTMFLVGGPGFWEGDQDSGSGPM